MSRIKHLRENSESYFSHLKFAVSVGVSLIVRGVIFLVHGVCPLIRVPSSMNLETTKEKLETWHQHTESRRKL
jgi:hypothetical protein